MSAAWLIARALGRTRRPRLMAEVATFAVAGIVVAVSYGILVGSMAATDEVLADFYTGQGRTTPEQPGTAPAGILPPPPPGVEPRLETQIILGTTPFYDAATRGNLSVEVAGRAGGVALGIAIGLPEGAAGWQRIEAYLVEGRLPRATPGALELLVSTSRHADLFGPGTPLAGHPLEVTTGRIEAGILVRMPARIVGTYDTGLLVLDQTTVVTDQASLATLAGATASNVWLGGAQVEGVHEGPEGFRARYAGPALAAWELAVAALSGATMLIVALLALEAGRGRLRAHGASLAVARAVGVRQRDVRMGAAIAMGWRLLAASCLMIPVVVLILTSFEGTAMLPYRPQVVGSIGVSLALLWCAGIVPSALLPLPRRSLEVAAGLP